MIIYIGIVKIIKLNFKMLQKNLIKIKKDKVIGINSI